MGSGWVDSLFSLAFATRWNPKYPSHLISVLPLISAWPQISAASLGIHIEKKRLPLISASPLISTAPLNTALIRLYVIIMSRTSFRVNPHSIVCLNVKELLTRGRHHIWSLSDSNEIRSTHNHLVRKRTLNHELSGCGFESRCFHLNLLEYILLVAKPKCI